MRPGLFISYSRRQTPFVDRLVDKLGDSGYPYWLDYQCMVAAKPWKKQILDGIQEADVFLLVVSSDSLKSKNVEPEWKYAVELSKPVVLLIFEAIPLPVELQNYKWVDFRVHYKKSFQQLENLLDQTQHGPVGRSRVPPFSRPPAQSGSCQEMFMTALRLVDVSALSIKQFDGKNWESAIEQKVPWR